MVVYFGLTGIVTQTASPRLKVTRQWMHLSSAFSGFLCSAETFCMLLECSKEMLLQLVDSEPPRPPLRYPQKPLKPSPKLLVLEALGRCDHALQRFEKLFTFSSLKVVIKKNAKTKTNAKVMVLVLIDFTVAPWRGIEVAPYLRTEGFSPSSVNFLKHFKSYLEKSFANQIW